MKKLFFVLLFPSLLFGSWAEDTLSSMTLKEKIGQLMMVATSSFPDKVYEMFKARGKPPTYKLDHDYIQALIDEYHIGGLLFLYKNLSAVQAQLIYDFQQSSRLPLLIGQDCEWGLSMTHLDGVRYPHNMTLGAIQNSSLLYEFGREVGQQCKAIGVHMNFAPVVDVNNNPKNPVINYRAFGDDKEHVAQCGYQVMRGMQDAGILCCAKHFPGHGDTAVDSHLELPTINHSKARLEELELYPFSYLIDHGVDAIMLAHLQVPAYDDRPNRPTSLSKACVNDILSQSLGFNGLIITDGLGMKGITNHFTPGEAECEAFLAGNDIILCPLDVPKAVEKIEHALRQGLITEQELDRRVLKILTVKENLGIYLQPWQPDCARLQTEQAKNLKKQLYAAAVTQLGSLPIARESCFIQCGKAPSNTIYNKLKEAGIAVKLVEDYSLESLEKLRSEIEGYKKVIVAYFEPFSMLVNQIRQHPYQGPQENYGVNQKVEQWIHEVAQDKEVGLCLFGNPYCLTLFKSIAGILMAYENDEEAQNAVAQILLGEGQAEGHLPIALNYNS